jgi:superfamily II DNA helicase RecQ
MPDPSLRAAAPGGPSELEQQRLRLEERDGAAVARFRRSDFSWSARLRELNRDYFGNDSFRAPQEAIINATLSGEDVFVLMPS